MQLHAGRAEHAPEHLGLPAVEAARRGSVDQLGRRRRRRDEPAEVAFGRDAVDAGRGHHDRAVARDDALGRGHALHRLIEVAIERVAAVGRHDDAEPARHSTHRCPLHERARRAVVVEHRGHPTVGVDGDVDRQLRGTERGRGPNEVVHRVALEHGPRRHR